MSNPYDATSTPSSNDERPIKMQYWRSYSYVFERKDWMANLLLCSVCFLIPVIGPLILMGYQFKVIEDLHKHPGQKMPKFDFSQFSELLSRGIYPFVVSLILQLVLTPLCLILWFLPMLFAGMFENEAILILGIFVSFILILVASVLGGMITGPFLLRAGLSQSFGETFNFGWILHFMRMVWIEEIVSTLFFMFSSMLLVMVGLLLCFVGVYPAAALCMLAHAQMTYQQYEIFLARGGEPIPLKTPPAAPVATLHHETTATDESK